MVADIQRIRMGPEAAHEVQHPEFDQSMYHAAMAAWAYLWIHKALSGNLQGMLGEGEVGGGKGFADFIGTIGSCRWDILWILLGG